MRILVTDDSKSVHAFIKTLFKGTSHELEHSYDGEQAFQAWQKSPNSFDLILLDWEMPVLDGYGTLCKLIDNGCQAPIIMVTSKNDPSYITKAIEKGAVEYVMKPFDRELLFEKLEMVLGKKVA